MFSKLCKSRSANQIKLCVCVCLFVCLSLFTVNASPDRTKQM